FARCFPIVIGVKFKLSRISCLNNSSSVLHLGKSTPAAARNISSLYSVAKHQLASIIAPNCESKKSDDEGGERRNDSVLFKNICADTTLKSFRDYEDRKGAVGVIILMSLL